MCFFNDCDVILFYKGLERTLDSEQKQIKLLCGPKTNLWLEISCSNGNVLNNPCGIWNYDKNESFLRRDGMTAATHPKLYNFNLRFK